MNNFNSKLIEDAVENGLGDGPLTLIISCTECNANFELNRASLVMAIGMRTTLLDYIRYVQNSHCPACEEKGCLRNAGN